MTSLETIKERAEELYDYIKKCEMDGRPSPSYREMAEHTDTLMCDMKDTLDILVKQKRINRSRSGKVVINCTGKYEDVLDKLWEKIGYLEDSKDLTPGGANILRRIIEPKD